MKFNKALFILLALTISIVQCKKDNPDDESEFNPSVMCIINSIDFNTNLIQVETGPNATQITATSGQDILILQIESPLSEGQVVSLAGTGISSAVFQDNSNSIQYISDDGTLSITRYEEESGELEGSFQFHGIEFFGTAECNVINGQFMAIVP